MLTWTATAPDHELFHQDLLDQLEDLMEPLDKRERNIIIKRFGLNGKSSRTLEQVGKEFGVTRERIRQLQNVAIAKMRQSLQRMEDPSVQALEGVMEKFRDTPELAPSFLKPGLDGSPSSFTPQLHPKYNPETKSTPLPAKVAEGRFGKTQAK